MSQTTLSRLEHIAKKTWIPAITMTGALLYLLIL
jgi:hypothetical protein